MSLKSLISIAQLARYHAQIKLMTARKAASIPYGQVDNTSTNTAFTATIDGITELRDGVCCYIKNGVITSAAGCTLNVNNLGAKPIYQTLAAATAVTTAFNVNYTMLFVYNSSRVNGGCWDMFYGFNSNTTYSNASLGQGYATCSTAASTTAKTASLSSYALTVGGYVSVKFTHEVPANSTLSINSKTAKPIYYNNSAITSGIIKANDLAVFVYNGSQYHLVGIDRWGSEIEALRSQISNLADRFTYRITSDLVHCTSSNTTTSVMHNDSYTTTITADEGYTLDEALVYVSMDGNDITSSAYNDGLVSIEKVVGDIVIQLTAQEKQSIPNQIPISTDASGNVFNTTGYKEGYRLNSSGAEAAYSGSVVTGFMPFVLGQEIVFDKFSGSESSNGGVYFYNSAHTLIASNKVNTLIANGILTAGQPLDYKPESPTHDSGSGNMKSLESVAYIRISAISSNPTTLTCGII